MSLWTLRILTIFGAMFGAIFDKIFGKILAAILGVFFVAILWLFGCDLWSDFLINFLYTLPSYYN